MRLHLNALIMSAMFAVLAEMALASPARAGAISGDATTGNVALGNLANATQALFAFSQVNNITNAMTGTGDVAAGALFPNVTSRFNANDFVNGVVPGYTATNLPVAQATAPGGGNVAICVRASDCPNGGPFRYSPSVAPVGGNQPKARFPVGANVLWSGTPAPPNATATGVASYIAPGLVPQRNVPGGFNLDGLVAAAGSVARGVNGKAAGAAFDPAAENPGSFAYDINVDASLQLDPNQSGGLTYFATDSQITDPDTFYGQTENFSNTLWSLTIAADAPITSAGDLLDPNILSITMSLTSASLLSVLKPDDTPYSIMDLENAIRGGFTYSNGVATLSDFDIFPSMAPGCGAPGAALCGTTTYTVTGSNVIYGDGIDAALTSVPEPPSGVMLVVPIALSCLLRRGRLDRRSVPRS